MACNTPLRGGPQRGRQERGFRGITPSGRASRPEDFSLYERKGVGEKREGEETLKGWLGQMAKTPPPYSSSRMPGVPRWARLHAQEMHRA